VGLIRLRIHMEALPGRRRMKIQGASRSGFCSVLHRLVSTGDALDAGYGCPSRRADHKFLFLRLSELPLAVGRRKAVFSIPKAPVYGCQFVRPP
jgi:hypothetical protein